MQYINMMLLIIFTAGCTQLKPSAPEYDVDARVMECYSYSQIAYDSVVNSHVGLPVETVVPYLRNDPRGPFYMNIMFTAYSWKGTAHEYSAHVFTDCFSEK